MGDLRDALERERDRHSMGGDALERLQRRRDRHRRNQRLVSGAVALVVFGAGATGLVAILRGGAATPAHRPTPSSGGSSSPGTGGFGPAVTELPRTTAIDFVDDVHGWLAADGKILVTTNGGATWHVAFSTQDRRANFAQLDFVDAQHGWALAPAGELIRTADGGHTWTAVTGSPSQGPLRSIDLLTPSLGWGIAGGDVGIPRSGVLLETTDGGATWQSVHTPGLVDDVCFADPSFGWATSGEAVFGSQDGGRTWETVFSLTLPGGAPIGPANVRCAGNGAYVLFHDGAAAGSEGYVVERTLDGGATWEPVLVAPIMRGEDPAFEHLPGIDRYTGPFQVLDASTAVFFGQCPNCDGGTTSLTRTASEGGGAFQQLEVVGLPLAAARFADGGHGWVVVRPLDQPDRMYRTVDGGLTWTQIFPG